MCRVPDRLHHVPEVVAAGVERAMTEDGERAEARPRRRPSPRRGAVSALKAMPRSARASARRGLLHSPARGRRRARRRRCSGVTRRIAATSASGSPGGTSSALFPSSSSSRAAGVSAVTTGVPHASAWKTLFGITRAAFAEVPKIPSAQEARVELVRQAARTRPRARARRSPAGRRADGRAGRSPTIRKRRSGASRAAARIVSSPCSGISFPTNRARARLRPTPARRRVPRRRRSRQSTLRAPRERKSSAFAAVSETTRSAARRA